MKEWTWNWLFAIKVSDFPLFISFLHHLIAVEISDGKLVGEQQVTIELLGIDPPPLVFIAKMTVQSSIEPTKLKIMPQDTPHRLMQKYRIEATVAVENNKHKTAAVFQIGGGAPKQLENVGGGGAAAAIANRFEELQKGSLKLICEKKEWNVGETAEITVESSIYPGEGLYALTSNGIQHIHSFHIGQESTSQTVFFCFFFFSFSDVFFFLFLFFFSCL
jgi:hypothetical protein